MSEGTIEDVQADEGFTVETFAAFWAKPEMSAEAAAPIAQDAVGYWPGDDEPLRGREAYVGALVELLRIIPDLSLEVAESAQDGEYLFIRWIAHATDADGRAIEHTGVDRIRVVDGKVVENRIFFDRAQFERKLGRSLAL
ncbi:SnoaL-like domain-containing protein [Thermoleophilia bacterium SCSIO 60948]|nr:SnoaL-like domain-containing protein [Thermoleophilia bacterium SCSIO 60948]